MITGAAGMIGSGLVRFLNQQGEHQLLLVDRLRMQEKWKNLVGKSFLDLISPEMLFEWLQRHGDGVKSVVHLGACSDTTEQNADYLLENNYRFSIRLAEWALLRNCRLIYASSAATYGDGKRGFVDEEAALSDLKPLNMYGYSKHLVDLWMERQGLFSRVVGLKYFNVFGPNEYHKGKMASMVFKMARIAEEKGTIALYKSNSREFADGEQQRDFIYVKDAVRRTALFLEPAYQTVGGIYNLGCGVATTWNRLARALFRALGLEEKIRYIDMPVELSTQYQNYTCAEMGKFSLLTAAEPISLTDLDEAVQDYVQNYLCRSERW